MPVVWRCAVLKDREGWSLAFSGGFGEGETPLPIPNRAVKPLSADGTWPARAWESRTPPVFLDTRVAFGRPVVVPNRVDRLMRRRPHTYLLAGRIRSEQSELAKAARVTTSVGVGCRPRFVLST